MASPAKVTPGNVEKDSTSSGRIISGVTHNVTETDALYKSSFSLDPEEEYKMDHKKRGLALIFNQENFFWKLGMPPRYGTNMDRHNLVRRFQDLQFEVRAFDNLKLEEVWSKINEAAESNHTDFDCFTCIFLSHGENDHVFAYDGKICIQDITALFKGNKCPSLAGKPKLFILQACRGDKHDDPVTPMDVVDHDTRTNEVEVDAGVVYTLPSGADFLMCYSVAEGYYSHRETVNGTWYIQDLCEILKEYGQTLEITELLTLVNRKVSRRSVGQWKQVPCFASMLTKKLYFRPKHV